MVKYIPGVLPHTFYYNFCWANECWSFIPKIVKPGFHCTVFLLTSVEGNGRYQLLPRLVQIMPCFGLGKCRLWAQPFCERHSCNEGKIKTWGLEQTIAGLRLLKDAVKFHDPVNCRPEKTMSPKKWEKWVRLALGVQGKIRPGKGREEEGG